MFTEVRLAVRVIWLLLLFSLLALWYAVLGLLGLAWIVVRAVSLLLLAATTIALTSATRSRPAWWRMLERPVPDVDLDGAGGEEMADVDLRPAQPDRPARPDQVEDAVRRPD